MRNPPDSVIAIFNCSCNYRCVFCSHGVNNCAQSCWTFEKTTKDLDSLWSQSGLNNIGGCGEISTIPYFKKLMEYFDSKPGRVCFSTNGSKLDVAELRKHRLYEIVISIHTTDEATYDYLTGSRGHLPQVMENARLLCEQPRDYKAILVAVITQLNVKQMPALAEFALSIGADQLRFLPLIDSKIVGLGESYPPGLVPEESEENTAAMKEAERILSPVPDGVRPVLPNCSREEVVRRNMSSCQSPSCQIVIGPTGEVQPCCFIPDYEWSGNAFETPWEEIWDSDLYNQFREQVADGTCELCLKYCKNWG